MTGFELRPETPDDAEAVAALSTEAAAAFGAARPPVYSVADVQEWRAILGGDAWVVFAGDELAGAADLFVRRRVGEAAVRVSPRFRGRGLSSRLVSLTEERAKERGTEAVRQTAPALDTVAGALLEARGYRRVRSYYLMGIELPDDVPEPVPPEGIVISPLRDGQERALHAAIVEAFADDWSFAGRPFEEWRAHRLEGPKFERDTWHVATDGDEVAGVAFGARHGGRPFVENLAVRRPWRRRGLGLALLRSVFAAYHRMGERDVALGVDSENPTGATRLYERAGMAVEWREDIHELLLPKRGEAVAAGPEK